MTAPFLSSVGARRGHFRYESGHHSDFWMDLETLCARPTVVRPFAAELARKIASPLGLAEIVAVRRRLGRVEPVAQGYLSMQALAHAEGWILIPADSEGHPAGARVVVRPWP